MATSKALVATNDVALLRIGRSELESLNFIVKIAKNEAEILQSIHSDRPDVLILDTEFPGAGGLEICRKIRENPATARIPIIMVLDQGKNSERIKALEMGADSCVSRPLQIKELTAQVKAVCRRAAPDIPTNRIHAGPIDMDLDRWMVTIGGVGVDLTKKEFRLLQVLLEAKGRALSRDFILNNVWSYGTINEPDTRTVDVHISRLRRKLGNFGDCIITVRNVGFRFDIWPEFISGYMPV
jgi:DNA-binding response OmpR family regulator